MPMDYSFARSLNRLAINSRQGGGIYGRAAPQLRDGCWHFMSPNVIGICLPLITTRPEVSALTSLSNKERRWDTQYVIYQVSQAKAGAGFSLN
ncbi:hypothetical protein CT19431_MP120005 [Cupriavidus taiwanensis]|nr:hypothetical protein CT19431_MP120005 [Cupriavidus taiwanensis]